MLKYIETFDIRKFPGEDVSTATLRIKDVCRALGHSNLPSDTVLRVLEGFMHASTESFCSFCQTQHNLVTMEDYAVSRHDKVIPIYKMLSRVLDMVGKMYVDLKSGDLWVGTSNEAHRHLSAFNVELQMSIGPTLSKLENKSYLSRNGSRLPSATSAKVLDIFVQIVHFVAVLGAILATEVSLRKSTLLKMMHPSRTLLPVLILEMTTRPRW